MWTSSPYKHFSVIWKQFWIFGDILSVNCGSFLITYYQSIHTFFLLLYLAFLTLIKPFSISSSSWQKHTFSIYFQFHKALHFSWQLDWNISNDGMRLLQEELNNIFHHKGVWWSVCCTFLRSGESGWEDIWRSWSSSAELSVTTRCDGNTINMKCNVPCLFILL